MTSNTSKTVRVLCLLAAALLALTLFAGCKGGDDTSSDKSASKNTTSVENTELVEQYEDKSHPTLPETKDLGGFEMLYALDRPKYIIPEQGESAEGDLILEALAETQQAYNCTILVQEVAEWDEAMTSIISGEQYANVIMPRVHQAGGFLQSRLCADFLEEDISQYVDMSQPWWNDTMSYASNVLGSVYAGASAIMSPADFTFVIYFNKQVAKDCGIDPEIFYELYDKKEWNWDNFVKYGKMAVKDLDGSGAVESLEDRWGLVAPGYDTAQAFCSSAKVASVTTTDGMNPTYTFNTTHSITTLTKLNQLFTTDGIYCLKSWDNNTKPYRTMFSADLSLFYAGRLAYVTEAFIRDMESDWGLLPMPIGPKEGGAWQDKYMSRVDHNFNLCIIPSTVEDKASTALILESMTFNYFKIINKKVDTYATLYCRDDKSVEIANTIYNTSTFEISQFLYSIYNGDWNRKVETNIRHLVNYPARDISGDMNSCAEVAQQMIDNYFNGV